jgi:ribonucleotide reductase beta subunit family protein with ferritin-like domain
VVDTSVTSLHTIADASIDPGEPLLREYPAFKLGAKRSVLYFARLLLPLARQLIERDEHQTSWVLTAPAMIAAPAAANLLCRELHPLLRRELPAALRLSVVEIGTEKDAATRFQWKEGVRSFDYATLGVEDRVRERQRLSASLVIEPEFRDGAVLFVNDIRVTGAHQCAMERYFERARARAVHWLYVVDVVQAVGRSEPRLEARLNHTSLDELMQLLACEEIEYTSKCIQRVLLLGDEEIEQLLRRLDAGRTGRLLELTIAEGYSGLAAFRPKVDLLRSHPGR